MNKLVIPVTAVPEGGAAIDARASEVDIRPDGVEPVGLSEVRVQGTLVPMDNDYLFRGHVTGVYRQPCARCLRETTEKFDLQAAWFFERGPVKSAEHDLVAGYELDETLAEDQERTRTFDGVTIDLRPDVWEEIVLAAPPKILCDPACKGLCPVCGVNRNEVQCDCEARRLAAESKFGALADKFPELRSKEE
ncbi:MAG: DUF177 domain-containing protein [Candidatus Hydrogenedentales bacterium]